MKYIETIKIENGQPVNLEYHLKRIEYTIGRRLPVYFNITNQYHKSTIKCKIIYDKSAIIKIEYLPYKLPEIKSLKLIECNTLDYKLKYEDRTQINLLKSICKKGEDILITQNGNITDTSFCNVVFENSKGLFTPATPLLNGTKRQQLLQTGQIIQQQITINDIAKYDKIRLINAMIDLPDIVLSTESLESYQSLLHPYQ